MNRQSNDIGRHLAGENTVFPVPDGSQFGWPLLRQSDQHRFAVERMNGKIDFKVEQRPGFRSDIQIHGIDSINCPGPSTTLSETVNFRLSPGDAGLARTRQPGATSMDRRRRVPARWRLSCHRSIASRRRTTDPGADIFPVFRQTSTVGCFQCLDQLIMVDIGVFLHLLQYVAQFFQNRQRRRFRSRRNNVLRVPDFRQKLEPVQILLSGVTRIYLHMSKKTRPVRRNERPGFPHGSGPDRSPRSARQPGRFRAPDGC